MKGKKNYFKWKVIGVVCIAVLGTLLPREALADNRDTVTKKLHHLHTGNQTDRTGCYTKAVMHIHNGNPEKGGGCYTYPILHLHTGDALAGGGCYTEKVFHNHIGSEGAGGACYRTPVYHGHKGNGSVGGDCYSIPVLHRHEGTQAAGGKCYEPVYHRHSSSCYSEETCSMKYEGGLKVNSTYSMYCYHHGDTQHASITGNYSHSSCGKGITQESKDICWTCKRMDKKHTFLKEVCGKTERIIEGYRLSCRKGSTAVDGFELGCGKNTNTVDSYQKSCTKTEQSVDAYKRCCGKNDSTIDAYARNCNKTEKTIEYYVPDCGLEEEAFGYMALSNANTEWTSDKVLLEASYAVDDGRDNGIFKVGEEAFLWEEESGFTEGTDSGRKEVYENGTYSVRLNVLNESVVSEEPFVSLKVKNIDKTAPVIEAVTYNHEESVSSNVIHIVAKDRQPDGSEGSGLAPEPYSYDGGITWSRDSIREIKENGTIPIRVRDACGNAAKASAEINNIQIEETPGPEEPKEEPEDAPKEDPKEEPEDAPKEEPKEEPEDAPKEEPKEEPEDAPKEDPKEEPEDAPKEDPKEEAKDPKEDEPVKGEADSEDRNKGDRPESKPPGIPNVPAAILEKLPVEAIKKNQPKACLTVRREKEKIGGIKPVMVWKEREETVEPKQVLAEKEMSPEKPKQVKNHPLLPVAKAAAFTFSSIVGIASLLWLIYMLFRNIRVFYSDAEEKYHYAGSCILQKKEDIFEVTIPGRILDKSDTGLYMLRPSYLFLRRNKGKEMIITADRNKKSVWADSEIPFRR